MFVANIKCTTNYLNNPTSSNRFIQQEGVIRKQKTENINTTKNGMFNTHTDIMELLCLKYLNKLREQVGDKEGNNKDFSEDKHYHSRNL